MFARRSLGDSPLEHNSSDIGLLDFIGRESDQTVLPINVQNHETEHVHDESRHTKMTVSYYLELHLVKRIKALATLTERSYSSIVTEALQMVLRKYGF